MKIVVMESEEIERNLTVVEFKTDPKGEAKEIIRQKDWRGDSKELTKQMEANIERERLRNVRRVGEIR